MQVQSTRTEVNAVTATQSLAAIQTLLKAGLGCITYLRDLLPEDNFTQSHLVADEGSLSYQGSDASSYSTSSKESRNANGFKIMTMTRGYSDEADKILNYLEHGIFHALEKRYLRSFIFAIYLDNKDPTNIIEAYTFNFHYHTIPGTAIVVPIMTLGDGLQNLSLKDGGGKSDDPLTKASKRGKAPTLLDVKKSVKALLKTLIHATTQMDVLPKRRFATFKLFYTDETPADYEPPHFQAGDSEKDKWFFMTHELDEVPDRWSIGKVDTGYHSIDLSVTSIATYLPSSGQRNNATFLGTTSHVPPPPVLTPIQEAILRTQQAKTQTIDAEERNIVWSGENDVELSDLDGEGDEDPDYVRLPDGSYEKINTEKSEILAPVGLRNSAGEIEPLTTLMDVDETHFAGISEAVPTRLNDLNAIKMVETSNVDQTQDIGSFTEDTSYLQQSWKSSPSNCVRNDLFSSSDHEAARASPVMSPITSVPPSQGDEPNMLKDSIDTDVMEETKIPNLGTHIESIESYGPSSTSVMTEKVTTIFKRSYTKGTENFIDHGLKCNCGIAIEDGCCFCEGGCGRWYHVWCMGYHSVSDPRLPSEFICFDCRVRADPSWELIKVNLYPMMLLRFDDLALFRRAIKIAETRKVNTPASFTKAYGGSNILAHQLFKRLETEGFVTVQSTTLDDLGFPETRSRSLKGGHKAKGRNRKNIQKIRFTFNRKILPTAIYSDYFNPDPIVEGRLLKLSELTSHLELRNKLPNHDILDSTSHHPSSKQLCSGTQTQEETQFTPDDPHPKPATPNVDLNCTPRPKKKVKISVTHGLDLAE